ncbi:MAG: DUF3365 domain-containing protein [Pseudomonadota bacterium]
MGLRFKYNIVLVVACLLGIAVSIAMSYVLVRKSAVQEVEQSIDLLREKTSAVRYYTLNSIEPLLADNNDILFLPETVTSYAARTIFAKVQEKYPDYSYKEAALNPTNPADLPTELEASLIKRFRADPSLEQITTIVDGENGRILSVAYPVTIKQEGCLRCHSTPEAAPPAMVDLYGPDNGFGWQMGETVGAQIISAPISLVDKRALESVIILVSGLGVAFVVVFVTTNALLSRIVLRPVERMSEMAEKVSHGDFAVPEYSKPGRDEISALSASFNRMRRSLERAMMMIDV